MLGCTRRKMVGSRNFLGNEGKIMRSFTGEEFEDEVKRICRNLFSNEIGQGSEKIDGRERDGIFWNGDFFTVVEATTEKKKTKHCMMQKNS